MNAALIVFVAAVGLPLAIRLLLGLEKRLANSNSNKNRHVTAG